MSASEGEWSDNGEDEDSIHVANRGQSEVDKFNSFLLRATRKGRSEGSFHFAHVAGSRVYKLSELANSDDYLIIDGATADVRFVVKKIKQVSSKSFSAKTVDHKLSIQTADQATRLSILGFQDSIEILLANYYDLLLSDVEQRFGKQADAAHRFGICMSMETDSLRNAVNSGLWDLTRKNRDHLVSEVLNALTKALISSSPQSRLEELHIKASLIDQAPLRGDGYKRVYTASDFVKKSYHPQKRPRGGLLLAQSDEKCMFVSTYLGWMYNRLAVRRQRNADSLASLPPPTGRGRRCAQRARLLAAQRALRGRLLKLAELTADEQLRHTARFFQNVIQIDISSEEEGTLSLLEKIFQATGMQVTIHCQSQQYRKMLSVPEHVDIFLPQIRLIRYQLPRVSDKSMRGKTHTFHYNASLNVNALLTSQGYSICIFCNEFKPQKMDQFSHKCSDHHYPRCGSCRRPKVSEIDARRVPPPNVRAAQVCVVDRRVSMKRCEDCQVPHRSLLCLARHTKSKCRSFFTCARCQARVRYVGKYSRARKRPQDWPTHHENCDEVYCLFCEDFFPHVDGLDRPHVCMTRTPGPPKMPSGLMAFDIEASVSGDRDTFSAVTICCIYQEKAYCHDEYRAVVFSEIGTEYRGVAHGSAIQLEPGELIDGYFPYHVMREGNPYQRDDHDFYTAIRRYLRDGEARTSFPDTVHLDTPPDTTPLPPPAGSTVIEQFVSFLLQPRFKGYTVVSHYGRGFDNQFVLRECLRRSERIRPIFQGNKILSLKIVSNSVTLLDTNAHIPLSLRELAKKFGLDRGKTFFPFTLLKRDNYKMRLAHLPPKGSYEPEQMSKAERAEFLLWHAEHADEPFDMAHVVVDYCMRDTTTLLSAAQLYIRSCFIVEHELWNACCSESQMGQLRASRTPIIHNGETLFLANTHVFSADNCTSASYANRLFLSTTRQHVPIVDDQYANSHRYLSSQAEVDCAHHLRATRFPALQFSLSQAKQKRLRFGDGSHVFLDMWDADTRTAIEFHGCIYHGCRECAKKGVTSPYRLDFDECYAATKRREEKIRAHPDVGRLEVIWQCEFDAQIARDGELRHFLEHRPKLAFPALREALRGGYVSCFAGHVSAQKLAAQYAAATGIPLEEAEKIFSIYFLDINSQYPSQCVSVDPGESPALKVPTSPPLVLFWPDTLDSCSRSCCPSHPHAGRCDARHCGFTCPHHCPVEQWDRVIGCANVTILPPRHCRVPILSVRVQHKDGTEFGAQPLCCECARTYTRFGDVPHCEHTDEQREIKTTVYLLEELVYAVEKQGYRIKTVHSVQYYQTYATDILKPLMNTLSKLKIANSAVPRDVVLADYVAQLNAETGLNFRASDFDGCSDALRLVAKLLMVAQLGKQSQTIDRVDKRLVFSFQDYRRIVEDRSLRITYFELLTDNCLLVHVRSDTKVSRPFSKGCLYLTCHVNMVSRIGLVESCRKLLEAGYVLAYCDTDSIVSCRIRPDAPPIDEVLRLHHTKLGYWKVEHADIMSAIIFNKKSYVLRLAALLVVIKCKGFHRIEELLLAHNRVDIMEQELAWVLGGGEARDIYLYQKQFRVNGRTFSIAMLDESASMKKLRLIGPRKYVKREDFVRSREVLIRPCEMREIRCGKRAADNEAGASADELAVKVKVAELAGYVPYLPFGFHSDRFEADYDFVRQK